MKNLRMLCYVARGLLCAALCMEIVAVPRWGYAIPIDVDDISVEVPTTRDYEYTVRAADLNGDGLVDLYVRGGYMSFAKDFVVLQTGPLEFVPALPNDQQRNLGRSLPKTSITVYREDLSMDGLLDFRLEDVDEVIPDAPDLIILTTRGEGTTPQALIKEDDEFNRKVNQISDALENLEAVLADFGGTTCTEYIELIPMTSIDWYTGENTITFIPTIFRICLPNSIQPKYSGDFGIFCGGMQNHLASLGLRGIPGGVDTASVVDDALQKARTGQILSDSRGVRVVAPRAAQILSQPLKKRLVTAAAKRAVITLSARALPTVALALGIVPGGAILELAVIGAIFLVSAGYGYYQERLLEKEEVKRRLRDALIAEVSPDFVGPPRPDPYRMKATCQPWTKLNTQIKAPTSREGDSGDLGKNLADVGCGCPPGTAAHHLIAKRAGGAGGERLRMCMEQAGINIDWAGNGICLPKNSSDPFIQTGRSKIAGHDDSNLHKDATILDLAVECENASRGLSGNQPGDPRFEAVKRFLDAERARLLNYQP